jgi:hypothetical protein
LFEQARVCANHLAHYGIGEDHPAEAGEVFAQAKKVARRNRDVLELLQRREVPVPRCVDF